MSRSLTEATLDTHYQIASIHTDDPELEDFLFTLGCYAGEPITMISKMGSNFIVRIKDGTYTLNQELTSAICV